MLPGAIQRRTFSPTSWPKARAFYYYMGIENLVVNHLLLFPLASKKLRARLASLLYQLCMCESFYRAAGCSSSVLLDIVKLLSKEVEAINPPIKRPRVPVSPSFHQHWISSQCLVFAKMNNLAFPQRGGYLILYLNCISLITQGHLFHVCTGLRVNSLGSYLLRAFVSLFYWNIILFL